MAILPIKPNQEVSDDAVESMGSQVKVTRGVRRKQNQKISIVASVAASARETENRFNEDISKSFYVDASAGTIPATAATDVIHQKSDHPVLNMNEPSGKWDAFASLQDNYESSNESGIEDDNDGTKQEVVIYGQSEQWNAFETLESNYKSSSSDEADCDSGDEQSLARLERENGKYIDLLSSDSDDELTILSNTKQEQQLDLADSNDEASNKNGKRSTKLSEHFANRKASLLALDDDSISEDDSPIPVERREGAIPPWQRSVPLHRDLSRKSTAASSCSIPVGNTLPSSSFSCMNGRNDVIGGSGMGVNGIDVRTKAEKNTKKRAYKTSRARKTSTKKTTRTKSVASKTSKSSSEANDEAKPKARKGRRSYRKKSKRATVYSRRRGTTNTTGSSNNAWIARERGIRSRKNNSGPSTYMTIGKQESALRNIGGATISF